MRILQIISKPQRRGAEVFAFQLSQWLRDTGHEVRTAYLYGYDGDRQIPLLPGDVVLSGKEGHLMEKVPGTYPGLLRELLSVIQEFSPDIIQVNGSRTVKYGAAAKRAQGRTGWKLVSRVIGQPKDWMKGWARPFYYRKFVYPYIDGLIGLSPSMVEEALSFHNARIPSVSIPNGVDLRSLDDASPDGIREAHDTPEDAVIALFVGSLSQEKRPDRFLRVLREAREREPRLFGWFLGDGSERQRLEEQVHREGLSGYIRFLGYQDKVAPYIAASDLLAITSDTEGIPAVVIEAGYLRKPIVGTRVGGMPKCVREGETGLLVPPEDESGFAEYVALLAQNTERRLAMGEAARAWMEQEFGMDRIGQQYLAFYDQVLHGCREPRS